MRSSHVFTALALAVLGLALVAPMLGEGSLLHGLFAPLCHQIPERSPALFGVSLPVCWRCLGVSAGLVAVAAGWRSERLGDRRAWPWLITLGVADFALGQLGLVADIGVERLVSGICLGVGLPLMLRSGAAKLRESTRELRWPWGRSRVQP